jgi:hypothetical protein
MTPFCGIQGIMSIGKGLRITRIAQIHFKRFEGDIYHVDMWRGLNGPLCGVVDFGFCSRSDHDL